MARRNPSRYGVTKRAAVPSSDQPDRLSPHHILVECPDCSGYGAQGERVCKSCSGCGRVVANCEEGA